MNTFVVRKLFLYAKYDSLANVTGINVRYPIEEHLNIRHSDTEQRNLA